MTEHPILAAALSYARRGWRVLPLHTMNGAGCGCGRSDCPSPGKHPFGALVPSGLHDATTDETLVREWWAAHPSMNVGIATGPESGIFVLDLDRHGDDDGVEVFRVAERANTAIEPTIRQLTGGGGEQIFFKYPAVRVPSRNRVLGGGVDTRGHGGYVVAPPSIHRSGKRYQWDLASHPDDLEPIAAPDWILRLVCVAEPGPKGQQRQKFDTAGALRGVPDGQRDETCFKLACKLRAADVPFDIAKALLIQAAEACSPAFNSGIAVEKVERAYRKYDPNADEETERPEITITTQIKSVVDASESALIAHDPSGIFQRGALLVRLSRDGARSVPWLMRAASSPIATQIGDAAITERLSVAAKWLRVTEKAGVVTATPAMPPTWVGRTLVQRASWRFPVLESIVSGPTLLPDGSILETPGYEPKTGTWYEPSGVFESVPDLPSQDDAYAAYNRLLEPIADFPMLSQSDQSVFVAAVLTILARPAISGPCPAFAFRATTPGSGKSLLSDVVSVLGTGRSAAKMAAPRDDDEMRKRILAIAIQGDAVTCFDNVSGSFGSESLSLALTATEFEDRILGESRSVRVPLRMVWLITGNNIRFKGDTGRRVIPCDLDPKMEHPEDRNGFKHPDLIAYVLRERGSLVRDALTILRGYHVAGRPDHGFPPKGSFETWDKLVRGALIWAGADDPLGTVERIRSQSDDELLALRTALHTWHAAFQSDGTTAADAMKACGENRELREALAALGKCPEKHLDSSRVGYALRAVKGRIADGMYFGDSTRNRDKVVLWVAHADEKVGTNKNVADEIPF